MLRCCEATEPADEERGWVGVLEGSGRLFFAHEGWKGGKEDRADLIRKHLENREIPTDYQGRAITEENVKLI